MGLKILYELRACVDAAKALAIVDELRVAALTLPFDAVEEPRALLPGSQGASDPDDWICATHFMRLRAGRREVLVEIPPIEAAWFGAIVEGSETAQFGLAARPATVRRGRRDINTGLDGLWTWQGSCKTQYAGMPEYGGPDNFLRAHLSVVAVLDRARELGADVQVWDDGGYWEHRNQTRLLAELHTWDCMIAGLASLLLESFDESDTEPLVAPILDHPDFEALAAEGRRLKPDLSL